MTRRLALLLALAAVPASRAVAHPAGPRGTVRPGRDLGAPLAVRRRHGLHARLADAIAFAIAREARAPRDMEESHYRSFGREPFGQGIGPFKPRGEPSGVILRGGYVVASWGEPDRVDMTHSVTKSFLSATLGLAFDRGLLASVRDTVWKSQAPTYRLRLTAPSEPGSDIPVYISENMVGHKLGEFSLTRTFKGHAADKKAAVKK